MEASGKALPKEKQIKEILPKAGLVYSEKATLSEILCKPKILPLKSVTLMKLE
jgi:BBSome-interacting protein 1